MRRCWCNTHRVCANLNKGLLKQVQDFKINQSTNKPMTKPRASDTLSFNIFLQNLKEINILWSYLWWRCHIQISPSVSHAGHFQQRVISTHQACKLFINQAQNSQMKTRQQYIHCGRSSLKMNCKRRKASLFICTAFDDLVPDLLKELCKWGFVKAIAKFVFNTF